ncbi:MAG: TlpA family protein disulfide reductase [Candidatus Neomarinimicrobiota bacterium]|tara:strand:+ start:1624 stop:2253 length:630 start_codon:yes stop_codon:yes gene_type:complete
MAKMIKLANYQGLLIILVGALAYLSYTNYNLEQDLEEYKGYYKTIAIKYVQEIMDKPELSAPDPEEMDVTTIDFESNMLLFNDLEGNEFSLRDFEDKVLFINYWATWCNPCLAEMPNMAELYNQYKENDNIVFLYLSKEDADTIIDYIPKDDSLGQLPIYKVVTDDDLFSTRGIPTTFIVNRNGEIVIKDVGSAVWNDQSVIDYLDKLL